MEKEFGLPLRLLKEAIEKKISSDPESESVCIWISGNAAKDLVNELESTLNREDDGK